MSATGATLRVQVTPRGVELRCPGWRGMRIGPAGCRFHSAGKPRDLRLLSNRREGAAHVLLWGDQRGR